MYAAMLSRFLAISGLLALNGNAALTDVAPKLKTFGTSHAAFSTAAAETVLFEYTISKNAKVGVMNHFWTTGDTDSAVFRYYVDDEVNASIEFTAPKAAGAFFGDAQIWGNKQNGKGGTKGGWYVNYKIPFGRHIRITVEGGFKNGFVILRGCENMPVQVGAVTVPITARMQLQKIESRTFQPLEWVPIVDLPTGDGLVFMTAIAANSSTLDFWEGCYHLYTPYDEVFPGTLLSSGMEDFFDSSYGFSGGMYHFPVSGCTHKASNSISAYRFHEEDIVAFTGGVKFQWRIGDLMDRAAHALSPKCFVQEEAPGATRVGNPRPTTVSAYAWIYTWPSVPLEKLAVI